MRTSREAYNRVIWDARLDRAAFTIGYRDSLAPRGIRETPLDAWDPNGDIPWHRISYLRCGGMVVWSREPPLDLLSDAELPAAAFLPKTP
jgi:uncharacterized protein (UPF0248 family)